MPTSPQKPWKRKVASSQKSPDNSEFPGLHYSHKASTSVLLPSSSAVKPVAKTLDERQQKIADGLQYAEEMKEQLVKAERERDEKIKEAAQDAQRILSEAREQSKEMIEHKTQEAAAQAEAIIRKASEATELERQKMLSDVRQEVARLVVATSSKVLSKELSDADKQSFSDAAAKELAGSAN